MVEPAPLAHTPRVCRLLDSNAPWEYRQWHYTWQVNGMLQSVQKPDGKKVAFEYDALGRRPAKIVGDRINRYIYNGKVRVGDSVFCPWGFQNQYFDEETGLAYNRFRYYDLGTGSYISQDPIGLAGDIPNMYSYVADSNSWVDPFGLLGAEALAAAQKMGANAEVIVQNKYGFAKNTEWVDSIKEGRCHIPDGMTNTDIYEVKCVKKQGYTKHIKYFVDTGKNVTVIVDTDTKLSKVLKQAEIDGKLKIERTDLKNRPKKISCG